MSAPGTSTLIGGINTALINNHHEAFYWWWKSNLERATLFHVDGHDDLSEAKVYAKILSERDYHQLNIANFICPAVYHEVISQVYWLNPHSEERTLIDSGKPKTSFSERNILERFEYNYQGKLCKYEWSSRDKSRIEHGEGSIITLDKVSIPKKRPLILDLDLDAFCCHRTDTLSFLPVELNEYRGTLKFEERIDKTMDVLAQLPKPDLITIASSQGDGMHECFVPPSMVGDVARYLTINLRKLYQ